MTYEEAFKKILDIYWEDGESKTELEEKLRRIEDIADEMYHQEIMNKEDEN